MLEKTHTPAALLLGALAGVLAATLCILGSAAWMAKQGCSASMAWPLATVSVCVGGFSAAVPGVFWAGLSERKNVGSEGGCRMWVYPSDEVRTSPETTAFLPQLPAESGNPKQPVPELLNAGEAMPDGLAQQPERLHRRMRHASRDCCLLAAAFLLGTAAAGALQAVCDASQQEMLSYFLQCWCGLFSISAPTSAAGLFCAEYAALAAAATLLLLLGLSAVGPVCIFLFTMLYGLGNGLLSAQMLAGADGKSILALLLLGIPAACAAGCLCMFGAAALQVSGRIRAYSFRKTAGQACSGARELMGQYLLVIVVFLPLCGAATGLAYLGGKIL